MATAQKLLSAQEFSRLPAPADGGRQELLRGEVVVRPPPGFRHGKVQLRVGSLLDQHVRQHGLGQVVTETGVVTGTRPGWVRGPDIACWSLGKLPDAPSEYPAVPPDLCVEVLSPHESLRLVNEKVREYLGCGVDLVWVVDPEARTVTVYHEPGQGIVLWDNEVLSGGAVLPGFSCPVGELFE